MIRIDYRDGGFKAERLNKQGAYRLKTLMTVTDDVGELNIEIRRGFIFNISRPGILAKLLIRDDDPKLLPAACVHDYLIVSREWPRLLALGPFLHIYAMQKPSPIKFRIISLALLFRSYVIDRKMK
ncbi:hypothetical protein D6827_00180 [Candidatus Parcubacteria bacterium]|nr:MAG: hypothetical protein D6827_00180 [Candidatus Parcubacteria bacterium]